MVMNDMGMIFCMMKIEKGSFLFCLCNELCKMMVCYKFFF